MALSPGDKLGPYECIALIGKGGMGEVWKAHDSRLKRDVAIKVSAAQFSERFEREAQAIAALNHPNICQLYDVGPNYLVMEYVEGPQLKGPLPLDQALKYAAQICDALDAAHKKAITHRDLKPANILVTKTGIKLLDFGLAKLGTSGIGQAPKPDDATLTMALTGKNEIVGTLYYMSPEQLQAQATGQEIDARSDIFSFGIVLYEMLTGKRAFEGSSPASVIAAIMERPAPSIADVAPSALDRVLKRCLAKDPDDRWQTARDLKAELEWIASASAEAAPASHPTASRFARLPWIAAGLFGVAALVLGFLVYRHVTEEPQRVVKMSVLPPEKAAFAGNGVPAVSPDGRQVAFAAALDGKLGLWVRDLSSLESRLLPGTEGASLPFWSPDNRSLGFFANGTLKRTDVAGGSVLTLCEAPGGRGGTWNQGDVIVFAPAIVSALFRVPAAGGTPTPVTAVSDQEPAHRYPWFLPDGRHFLYISYGLGRTRTTLYVADLDSGSRQALMPVASNVVYATPGYLLFPRELTLMAQPFDAGKLKTSGDPVPIAEQVSYAALDQRALFSSSQNGVLVYSSSGALANSQLTWFDRSGKVIGTVGAPSAVNRATIAPDGDSVAIERRDPQTGLSDIWLHDLGRGTDSRFTFNSANNSNPVWSPDSSHIGFDSSIQGPTYVYQRATSGAGQDELLDKLNVALAPDDWSRDGRYIIEQAANDMKTGLDLWVLPLFGDKRPFAYLKTNFNEQHAKLSPSGQWLAYVSDESKRNEVYVQTFPTPGGKWQISTNGGDYPVWSRDGKELFYIAPDRKMMAVEVKSGHKFEAGTPTPLFTARLAGVGFDVSKDSRFLIPIQAEQAASAPMTVVINWQAELKK